MSLFFVSLFFFRFLSASEENGKLIKSHVRHTWTCCVAHGKGAGILFLASSFWRRSVHCIYYHQSSYAVARNADQINLLNRKFLSLWLNQWVVFDWHWANVRVNEWMRNFLSSQKKEFEWKKMLLTFRRLLKRCRLNSLNFSSPPTHSLIIIIIPPKLLAL